MPMPAAAEERKRPGRKPAENRDKSGSRVLFCLGEGGTVAGDRVVLKEECASEGEAMIESLKRGAPYYRVEIWQARAVLRLQRARLSMVSRWPVDRLVSFLSQA